LIDVVDGVDVVVVVVVVVVVWMGVQQTMLPKRFGC